MVPTKRLWMLVALGIPIAVAGTVIGSPLIGLAYNILLLGAAWVSSRLGPSPEDLRFERRFDPVLSARVANRIELIVENDGPELMSFVLRDEPPGGFQVSRREFAIRLAPGERRTMQYVVTPVERGSSNFQGTWLRIACPLGLVVRQHELATEQEVRVYPNVLALREFDLLKQQGRLKEMGIRRSRSRGIGSEFESLRQYALGDDFRKIDWKATARRGELTVRQFERERNQSVLICIDIGRHLLAEVKGVRKLDLVLDSLLMLTNAAAMAGDLVGLLVYADGVRRYIPPRKGRAHVGAVIEATHDLVAEPVESDPLAAFGYLSSRYKRRSLVIVFTDYEDEDRARDLAASLGPMRNRHLMLVVRVLDPRLDEVVSTVVTTESTMYQKAAATMLLEDRRQAKAIIESGGLRTLDAEPQDLAARLVSFYFMVKEKSLL